VVVSLRKLDWHDVPRKHRSKRNFARRTGGAVFGHENRASASHSSQHAEQTSAAGKLRVRGYLDGTAHPRKFSCLGDDRLVGFERELQDRHCGSGDAGLHEGSYVARLYAGGMSMTRWK